MKTKKEIDEKLIRMLSDDLDTTQILLEQFKLYLKEEVNPDKLLKNAEDLHMFVDRMSMDMQIYFDELEEITK
jgi:hypothetical protein